MKLFAKLTLALLCAVAAFPGHSVRAADAPGKIWMRLRLIAPQNVLYSASIPGVGVLGSAGLTEKLDKLPAPKEADLLKSGQDSAWAPLAPSPRKHNDYSDTDYGFTRITLLPQPGKQFPRDAIVSMEFSTAPDKVASFHSVEEPAEFCKPFFAAESSGLLAVYVPGDATPAGLKKLKTITEMARDRLKILEDLKPGSPPHLTRVRVGTWMSAADSGFLSKSRAEIDFKIAEQLGVNMITTGLDAGYGIEDTDFAELAQKHGIVATTWTAWGMKEWLAPFDQPPATPAPAPNPAEQKPLTLEEAWHRDTDALYSRQSRLAKLALPNTFALAKHVNLGDEPSASFNADIIVKNPPILAGYRELMKKEGLEPRALGAGTWDEVNPLDERKKVASPETARLFYHTRRVIDKLTTMNYRAHTDAVKKYFPQADLIAVNYQAGLVQYAFIGNTNDLDKGQLDVFELGRQGAFHGAMTEDWTAGWELGLGQICLGADILRAAGRKMNLPLASYVVGAENLYGEMFAYLMQGVKENNLYLYGPYTNIGPVWADNQEGLKACARGTRAIKKVEDPIADGHVRPSRAAMLVASTSDIMQIKGVYFMPERQFFYIALKHSYVPIDIICEQDIAEDNLLEKYGLLYVTDPQLRSDVQKRIADWVKAGGCLWAGVGAGQWDEYNQPSQVLDPVFGVKSRGVSFQKQWPPRLAVPWATIPQKAVYEPMGKLKSNSPLFGGNVELAVQGIRMDCTPGTAEVIGTYDDGKPAICLNKFGQGQALLVGALVGQEYATQHYAKMPDDKAWSFEAGAAGRKLVSGLLEAAKMQRAVDLSIPGLYTSVWDAPQGTLVFLLNATASKIAPDVTVRVPAGAKVKAVESVELGAIKYSVSGEVVKFQLPSSAGPDMILLRQ